MEHVWSHFSTLEVAVLPKGATPCLIAKLSSLKLKTIKFSSHLIFCYPLWRVPRHLAEWHLVECHSSESPVTI